MTQSIPASALVNVVPGVIGAGGSPLSLNAIMLTSDPAVPIGTVKGFATATDVANFFGPSSREAALAAIYFNGFTGATQVPGTLFFAQYNTASVAAYLRGGSVAGLSLAALQALSGVIDVTVDGRAIVSANINLSSASSPSSAAALVQTGLQTAGGIFSGTGSVTADVLTISAVASGTLHAGDVFVLAGVTPGTSIVAQLSGTPGGIGTYSTTSTPDAASGAVTVTAAATCTYDSVRQAFVIESATTGATSTIGFASGSLSAGLKLTLATGAVTSQGAVAAVPATLMAAIVAAQQDWATFMTVAEPLLAVKLAFAAWVTTQNARFAYVAWDSDVTPTNTNPATGSFGYLTKNDTGVVAVYDPTGSIAAFVCGAIASINFNETAGRATLAFKGQGGLTPDVTDATVAADLIANGYSFYGQYATPDQLFQLYQNGQISGAWKWTDTYVNQIWLNAQLQLALMVFMSTVKSVPYNQKGYGLLRSAMLGTIQQFARFGGLQKGVELSPAQIAEVNNAAGTPIDAALFQSGFYLQILDPGATVRANRGSPDMTLWYVDGGSVQNINLASIAIL